MVSATRQNQRVVVLCDADNVEIRGRNLPRVTFDYQRLLQRIGERELVRAKIYRPDKGFPRHVEDEYKRAGFEVKRTYKNSDAWFIADAFSLATKYDVIAFVGGDLDLAAIIPLLHAAGVRVEVWGWDASTATRLKEMADEYIPLTSDFVIGHRPMPKSGDSRPLDSFK